MRTGVLVPLAEYLSRTHNPDCRYLEGVLVERNGGEINHSETQSGLNAYVRYQAAGFWSGVEARVQVKAERFRVPNAVILRGGKPKTRIVLEPPEVVVEVLSPDDRHPDVQEKIDDYLAFGIPGVWVIDSESRRAWMHTAHGAAREAKDGVLRNPAGDLEVPLALFTD